MNNQHQYIRVSITSSSNLVKISPSPLSSPTSLFEPLHQDPHPFIHHLPGFKSKYFTPNDPSRPLPLPFAPQLQGPENPKSKKKKIQEKNKIKIKIK